ncbi:2OG-Fe(II) oxygenase [Rheinheimera sp. YQF-2]|uniref:2OG-Fe(II) oxygenase n=1 Tax=Rheinheimera lutimaris TaxID=2740584 RepID=A0A7Y5AMM1_9GAMM|nr:2OG-Fe(II) oxygenase [Rheinheimera lutimaris]NRQ41153.1 2OG-Fe(II) oxygenase [Rheinheimera lutimaris]
MSGSVLASDALNFDAIIDAFYQHGWVWLPNFLSPQLNAALLHEAQHEAQLTPAGIGRQSAHQVNQQIRRDATQWFDGQSAAQQQYLTLMAQLQLIFNRRCFLGLFDFECHFARYNKGDYYQKHVDAFSGRSNRVLTTVSYLNSVSAGGELALYDEHDRLIDKFLPTAGSLVLFESERFPHQVLPAIDTRYSIAGWFRKNASINGVLDPAS